MPSELFPAFIKLDVEGFEAEALLGISQAVRALSFEFTTIQRDVAFACVENVNVRMFREKWLKPFFVLRAHPRSQIRHRRICDLLAGM